MPIHHGPQWPHIYAVRSRKTFFKCLTIFAWVAFIVNLEVCHRSPKEWQEYRLFTILPCFAFIIYSTGSFLDLVEHDNIASAGGVERWLLS